MLLFAHIIAAILSFFLFLAALKSKDEIYEWVAFGNMFVFAILVATIANKLNI